MVEMLGPWLRGRRGAHHHAAGPVVVAGLSACEISVREHADDWPAGLGRQSAAGAWKRGRGALSEPGTTPLFAWVRAAQLQEPALARAHTRTPRAPSRGPAGPPHCPSSGGVSGAVTSPNAMYVPDSIVNSTACTPERISCSPHTAEPARTNRTGCRLGHPTLLHHQTSLLRSSQRVQTIIIIMGV